MNKKKFGLRATIITLLIICSLVITGCPSPQTVTVTRTTTSTTTTTTTETETTTTTEQGQGATQTVTETTTTTKQGQGSTETLTTTTTEPGTTTTTTTTQTITATVTEIPQAADLMIRGMYTSPIAPTTGYVFYLEARIHNIGQIASDSCNFEITVNTPQTSYQVGMWTLPSIAPGGEYRVTKDNAVLNTPGGHQLIFEIHISDANSINNPYDHFLEVLP
jgi:hypothetical protein